MARNDELFAPEQPEAAVREPRLWVIVGATGTGKSKLSLDLAESLQERGTGAEIVNADAMQLYRGMDIGTAKLPLEDRRGIPHHLFDILSPAEEATVARYQPEARSVIAEIFTRGNDAILVGGSGLYISSVIFDFRFPPRDEALRASLESELERDGVPALYAKLVALDPVTAERVDARNGRRVVRALELQLLGETAHGMLPERPTLWCEATSIVGVHCERGTLVSRIDGRVEQMWAAGLLAEVCDLLAHGIVEGPTASRAIGYAQALSQLGGDLTEHDAITATQQLTRRYARRQVSWFKRYDNVVWVESDYVGSGEALRNILATEFESSPTDGIPDSPTAER